MANEKSVFKYLICAECGYKKTDPTGKAACKCKNCGAAMYLSDNWYARITRNGKTTVKAISPRKKDAENYIHECKVAISKNTLMPGEEKDTKWKDAADNAAKWWKDAVTKKEITQSTADFYKFNMVPLNEYFADKSLLTISKTDVLDYQVDRVEAGLKNATINHELTTLRRVYSLHLDRTTSDESPRLFARHTDLSRIPKLEKSKEKARFLTADEAKALLAACTPVVRMAVMIGLNTGLRKSNVLNLTWKHIDQKARLITLPGTMMKNRKPHTVDIPLQLVEDLKEWRKTQRLSNFVFPDHAGEEPALTIRNDFEKAVAVAELKDVTFHTMRHTFASQWLMNGGDLTTLSEVLAHSSIQITKDLYGHLSREHKRKAHDEFAAGFLSQFK